MSLKRASSSSQDPFAVALNNRGSIRLAMPLACLQPGSADLRKEDETISSCQPSRDRRSWPCWVDFLLTAETHSSCRLCPAFLARQRHPGVNADHRGPRRFETGMSVHPISGQRSPP